MFKHLHCVVIDAGPAAYLKPILEGWVKNPPLFDWSIRLGEKAAETLENVCGLENYRGADLNKTETAAEIDGDVMLISAGGWPAEKAHVLAGQARGVSAVQFVDSCYNYALRLYKDGLWTLPDRLLLVTAESVSEAVAEGVPDRICAVVGHPAWEAVSLLRSSSGGDILFVGAPVERDYGGTLGYTETEAWTMLKDVFDSDIGSKGNLFYAKHPEQSAGSLPPGVDLIDYDASLLHRFDTVTGMFSAPLVDAYLAGRRSLSLQPTATDTDMFFLSRQGYLPRITDRAALSTALSAQPPDPSAFARQIRGSGERVVGILRELCAA